MNPALDVCKSISKYTITVISARRPVLSGLSILLFSLSLVWTCSSSSSSTPQPHHTHTHPLSPFASFKMIFPSVSFHNFPHKDLTLTGSLNDSSQCLYSFFFLLSFSWTRAHLFFLPFLAFSAAGWLLKRLLSGGPLQKNAAGPSSQYGPLWTACPRTSWSKRRRKKTRALPLIDLVMLLAFLLFASLYSQDETCRWSAVKAGNQSKTRHLRSVSLMITTPTRGRLWGQADMPFLPHEQLARAVGRRRLLGAAQREVSETSQTIKCIVWREELCRRH